MGLTADRAPARAGAAAAAAARDARARLPRGRPAWERRYAATLPLLDVVAVGLAVLLVLAGPLGDLAPGRPDWQAGLLVLVTWPLAQALTGSYQSRLLGFGSEEFKLVLAASFRFGVALVVGCALLHLDFRRSPLLLLLVAGTLLLLLGRRVARRVLWARRAEGRTLHRMLVVGPLGYAVDVVREVRQRPDTGFEVVGLCTTDSHRPEAQEHGAAVLGGLDRVLDVIGEQAVDTVAVVGGADMPTGFIRRLAWQLEGTGIDLMVAPAITDVAGPRVHVRPVATLPMLYVEAPRFTGITRAVKSGLDRTAAVVLLLLALVPLLLVAALVKGTSRGPVFFRQRRLGHEGRHFTILKFRTMYDGADAVDLTTDNESDGLLFKIREDPRITPVGRVLRRLSVDELPQLLNVLRGDMSLVGPRPLPERLEDFVGDEHRRLLVKPGMTGLWQVSGRSDLDWEETVRLDLYYVENWSLALDMVILVRTLAVVLRGSGAY